MKIKQNIALVILMIFIAALTRLIPHYPNFTAVGAVALFGGAYLSRRMAFAIPMIAMLISDLILNNLIYAKQFPDFYNGFVLFTPGGLPTYLAFAAVIILGFTMLRQVNAKNVVLTSVVAAVIFFVITNFAVWAQSLLYPVTFAGLITCFTAAIPFFWNTLLGNLFFGAILFGVYEYVTKTGVLRSATQRA